MATVSTRQVEQCLRELAVLYRRLADYMDNGAVLLRDIRVKTQGLRRAFGQADTLIELAWMQAGKIPHRRTSPSKKTRRHAPTDKPTH